MLARPERIKSGEQAGQLISTLFFDPHSSEVLPFPLLSPFHFPSTLFPFLVLYLFCFLLFADFPSSFHAIRSHNSSHLPILASLHTFTPLPIHLSAIVLEFVT